MASNKRQTPTVSTLNQNIFLNAGSDSGKVGALQYLNATEDEMQQILLT